MVIGGGGYNGWATLQAATKKLICTTDYWETRKKTSNIS